MNIQDFSDNELRKELYRREDERQRIETEEKDKLKIENLKPIGTWKVTRDCGNRTYELGTYQGHIIELDKL